MLFQSIVCLTKNDTTFVAVYDRCFFSKNNLQRAYFTSLMLSLLLRLQNLCWVVSIIYSASFIRIPLELWDMLFHIFISRAIIYWSDISTHLNFICRVCFCFCEKKVPQISYKAALRRACSFANDTAVIRRVLMNTFCVCSFLYE